MNFNPQLSFQNIKTKEEYQQLHAYIELNSFKQILDTYGRSELQIVLDEFADY
jgi:GGDEF domain-containing protein